MEKIWLSGAFALAFAVTEAQFAIAIPLQCPPGHHFHPPQNNCLPCPDGFFMDRNNLEESCMQCTVCSGGLIVIDKCHLVANTLCGCPDDHVRHVDGCSPIPANSTADNCTLLLGRIEKNIQILRQLLNGTEERNYLEVALSEVRMVKRIVDSMQVRDDASSNMRQEILTIVGKIPQVLYEVPDLSRAALSFIVIHFSLWILKTVFQFKKRQLQGLCKRKQDRSIGQPNEGGELNPLIAPGSAPKSIRDLVRHLASRNEETVETLNMLQAAFENRPAGTLPTDNHLKSAIDALVSNLNGADQNFIEAANKVKNLLIGESASN